MILTQADIIRHLSANRSDSSYVAGGSVLNVDWSRQSDDIDIFHDTDEEIGGAANRDIETLNRAGYRVSIDVEIYGCVEATVSKNGQSTTIQWMSETKTRFFPLVRDDRWGACLQKADLAVNKIIASATRTKARDYVDLVTIAREMSPLGPLVMAAAGKPPNFSPLRIVEEIRRRGLSVHTVQYETVKGLPSDWDAATVRESLIAALASAEQYVLSAPPELVGLLAVDPSGIPVEIQSMTDGGISFRKATEEPEVMPSMPDVTAGWLGS
jgi:hypothetical protein